MRERLTRAARRARRRRSRSTPSIRSASSILRAHPEAAGLHRDFRIASEEERVAVLAEAMDVSEQQGRDAAARDLEGEAHAGPTSAETAQAVDAYARAMRARNWIDFDDLRRPRAARADRPAGHRARSYREQFRFISVDEFQDIDEQQYRLIALLAPPGANLCVIGDPDQAIYGFRGADASCFERFAPRLSRRPTVRLHAQLPLQRHDRRGLRADARTRETAPSRSCARCTSASRSTRRRPSAPKPSSWCRRSKG